MATDRISEERLRQIASQPAYDHYSLERAMIATELLARRSSPDREMVECASRALAADELGMGDPPAVVATIVEHQWRAFERQARLALLAAL